MYILQTLLGLVTAQNASRPFELRNIHNNQLKLVSDNASLFFADEKTIKIQELLSNFSKEKNSMIWAGKMYFCTNLETEKTLELCKYAVENIHWQIVDKPSKKAQIINKKTGKCLGYDFAPEINKKLQIVECNTSDFETQFEIHYLDVIVKEESPKISGLQSSKDSPHLSNGYVKKDAKEGNGGENAQLEKAASAA
ncbi:hypothetical protein EHP00_169 [Ecytonucleospora hepatopenaei]|uniref:Uncharacterized protein n=1 Tax=Ecytonucleospora hepatopenaei TaxID=646526 RepID=A0A1W0E6D5_9MICR|nr:hypothetical protein EHP00_169 [Ecytonucleospora hepatopenaei]